MENSENSLMQFWHNLMVWFDSLEEQQVALTGFILLIGFLIIEFFIRFVKGTFKDRGETEAVSWWSMEHHLFSLRLIFYAGLARISELPLPLQKHQIVLLHFVESVIVAYAFLKILLKQINLGFTALVKSPSLSSDREAIRLLTTIRSIFKLLIYISILSVLVLVNESQFESWFLSQTWWRYILITVLIAAFWILNSTIARFLLKLSTSLNDFEENTLPKLVLSSILWPIRILLAAIIVYSIKSVLSLPEKIITYLDQGILILVITSGFLFVYNLLDIVDYRINKLVERDDNLLDKSFAQFTRLILRLVVMTVAAIYLIQAISGKPVTALLAGLGIGALAVALAAQDTLKNLFGSVMIMADKPFEIGERVVVDGFDGIVERIGFRSSKIRLLNGHLVTIPNEKMASNSIENIGKRPFIRRVFTIGVTYDTSPEKLETALRLVKEILDNHQGMDPNFPPRVYFEDFGSFSLNIKVMYWFHPADYWLYMEFSEKLNFKIMKALEAEEIEFAFPTQTTYMAQDERRQMKIKVQSDDS